MKTAAQQTKQLSFSQAEYGSKKKLTRRDLFLAKMESVVPWGRLNAVIEPYYPKSGKRGRPPIGLERILRMFGYERFDNLKLVTLMNALYANEWSQLQNHFCPTLKLKEKVRIGARYRKRYYPPETPYQRVLDCESVSDDEKSKLRILHKTINPFDLRQKINAKLRTIFSMVNPP